MSEFGYNMDCTPVRSYDGTTRPAVCPPQIWSKVLTQKQKEVVRKMASVEVEQEKLEKELLKCGEHGEHKYVKLNPKWGKKKGASIEEVKKDTVIPAMTNIPVQPNRILVEWMCSKDSE